ncbi:hypothetical protein RclHR1_28910001 [Rhizophagus clarus]|uniref:RNase H type-1 domain-containing protein n=1 Tax=Rhizophagus clarus TaxID=94130 RepID=A0A2Z6R7U3_9GLOM|nr:hypothetical protein RclHR1_28910001 [Rhizophagus clarus]
MPRHTRSRRSHYNVHWNWAMMDELVDIRRDRNRAYHNINGRSRYDFWDSVANSAAKSGGTSSGITITMSFIVMVTLGGGCGRVPAKDIIANLERDFGRGRWYLDIQATTTIPDSYDHLYDRYVCPPTEVPVVSLVPGVTTNQKNRHWLVTLDGNAAPLFGKQLTVQPKKDTCIIFHWTSDCLSSPGDVIRLHPCLGCDAHVPFPAANKYTAVDPRCTFTISLSRSLILPTNCDRIRQTTTDVVSPYSWANLCSTVVSYYNRLFIPPDFSSSIPVVDGDSTRPILLRNTPELPSPVVLPAGSHYRYYTDGSLINLGTPDVSMGWSWVQIIPDAGYLNSVAAYAHGTIRCWPSSTRAEAAAIFAALSVTPTDSVVSIYTDSQAAIDVKGHDGNYWNDFANSLANSAHQSDDAFPLPEAILTSSHNVRLVYDDIICESNPRRLFKVHYQATYMRDLLSLKRFQFTSCLTNRVDYLVDWDLTWFPLITLRLTTPPSKLTMLQDTTPSNLSFSLMTYLSWRS